MIRVEATGQVEIGGAFSSFEFSFLFQASSTAAIC